VLPAKQASEVKQKIDQQLSPAQTVLSPACSGTAAANSVLLTRITTAGADLPSEYRALFYEHLVTELSHGRPSDTFLREGDSSAGPGCTAFTMHITVVGFKKGNQAVRASTGPLGLFLGTTSVSFKVELDNSQGKPLFADNMKKSNRSDSESLNVSRDIAKKIAKHMDKTMKQSG
jgi:hypothetical protein